MKKLIILPALVLFLLLINMNILAQQDYQIVQNFKDKVKQIEQSIKEADSLAQVESIRSQITQLQSDFQSHKNLLDKSLYPDDFSSSIAKLNNALDLRSKDFTHITTLQTQVSDLKVQIDTLNQRNNALLAEIEQMEAQHKQDIAKLEKVVAELRSSLRKRDELVMSMLGVLMPPSFTSGGNLTSQEKQQVYSKTQKSNIILNIKKSIDDNIKFLNATTLKPEDLTSMKKQQSDFKKMWQTVGPQITSIYSERKQDVKNLKGIDSAFASWDKAIAREAWKSVRQAFADHGIALTDFSSGDEFTQSVSSYIEEQIKGASSNSDEAKSAYTTFVDSVWLGNIKPNWVPYLTDNNMASYANINSIDSKISQWQSAAMPSPFNWMYVIIGILIVVIIVFIVRSSSSKKNRSSETDS